MAKYDKEARAFNLKKFYAKHRMFKVYLDKKEDAALIEHLDSHKNKSKAIRQLLNGAIIPVAKLTFDDDKLKELTDDIVRQIQNGELIMVTESETQGEWGKWIISEIRCPYCLEYYDPDCYSKEELNKCPNCGASMMKGGAE